MEFLTGASERRVLEEERFEFALHLGGEITRGATASDLGVDLGLDPGEIGPIGVLDAGHDDGRPGGDVVGWPITDPIRASLMAWQPIPRAPHLTCPQAPVHPCEATTYPTSLRPTSFSDC